MRITALPAFKDNYIWIITNDIAQTFICVDPGDAEPVLNHAKEHNLTLTDVLITHHHPDHAGGINQLQHVFPAINIFGPNDNRLPNLTKVVVGDEQLCIGELVFHILDTPGHTCSHICFYEINQKWLFCGDTLFSAGCGRVFDGTLEQLHHSLNKLCMLPEQTLVFCGHEYTANNLRFAKTIEPDNNAIQAHLEHLQKHPCSLPSTIALEKKINPFMRTTTGALNTFAIKEGLGADDSLAIFRRIRKLKDNFN